MSLTAAGPVGPRSRRGTARLSAALLSAALLLQGCAGSEGDLRILTIYSPHGREHLEFFATRFEEMNPGVDVQYVDMGSQEILERLRAERVNPQADVWWGAPAETFMQGAEDGLLEPFRPGWASRLAPGEADPDDLWFATYRTPEVIAWNSEALSPGEAPRDWDDVLDPRWTGEVLIREPLASGTMRAIFGGIVERERFRTGSIEAGWDWLLRLDAQTREYVLNPTILYQKLARQEGLVTLWTMPDIEMLKSSTGLPIDYAIPESGTPVVIDGIALVRGGPEPELARAFVEWAGDSEALLLAAREFFRIPARTDLPADSLPDWIREALPRIRPMEGDPERVRSGIRDWMSYWDEHIRRRGSEAARGPGGVAGGGGGR